MFNSVYSCYNDAKIKLALYALVLDSMLRIYTLLQLSSLYILYTNFLREYFTDLELSYKDDPSSIFPELNHASQIPKYAFILVEPCFPDS
jgi:hypothetical protein